MPLAIFQNGFHPYRPVSYTHLDVYKRQHTVLAFAAMGAIVLCAIVMFKNGAMAGVANGTFRMPIVNVDVPLSGGTLPGMAALCIGIFNSIMFPTIFTTTLERSTAPASATSGLLCVAIVGGAFVPLAFGALKDATNSYSLAFIVPLICYACLLYTSRCV